MMRQISLFAGRTVLHPNVQALGVVLVAIAALHLVTDPLPAGSEPLAASEIDAAGLPTAPLLPAVAAGSVTRSPVRPLSDGFEPQTASRESPFYATTLDPGTLVQPAPVIGPAPAVVDVSAPDDVHRISGRWALQMNVMLLERGLTNFASVSDYTALFTKQERIGGDLSDVQEISLKLRQAPFSVYMKWRSGSDKGQQVIFVEGQNEGNMLVKPGGLKGRLIRNPLALDPNGAMALSAARHPVTQAGLAALARTIIDFQQLDLARGTGFACELRDDAEFDGRPCYHCLVEYESPEVNPTYRRSEMTIDRELLLPVCVRNFTWVKDPNPETLAEDSLIEHYAYTEIRPAQQLSNADFDRTNPDYRMVR